MTQHILNHRTGLVLLALALSLGLTLYVLKQRSQQAAGFCEETGQRLSDAQILRKAEVYVEARTAAEQRAGRLQRPPTTLRVVSEAALRAEYQVPIWVKNTGGFRAYVEIVNQISKASDQDSHPDLIVVSNCGKIRIDAYEYFGGWLW